MMMYSFDEEEIMIEKVDMSVRITQAITLLQTVLDDLEKPALVEDAPAVAVDPVVETAPEPNPEQKPQVKFTPEQITTMKEIKSKLKVRDNSHLEPFINQWSEGKLSTVKDLDGENIDAFIAFMKERYIGEKSGK